MKNKIVLWSFLISGVIGFAQAPMNLKKVPFSGTAIFQNDSKISLNKAKEIAKDNEEIVKKLNTAQSYRTWGGIIGMPGGFAFGYTIGSSLGGKYSTIKPNWTVGGIGAAMMVFGGVLQYNGEKKLKEAVSDYNAIVLESRSSFNPEFNIVSSENGIGLSMKF